jgi:hypothetical protein
MPRRIDRVDRQVAKVRLNRVRKAAERQGLRLSKARRIDPRAVTPHGFGLWDDQEQNWLLARGEGWGCSLEEVELYLATGEVPSDLVESAGTCFKASSVGAEIDRR